MAISIPDMLTPGQIVADDPTNLRLLPSHLARHIFIAGGSGNGKSKLIELLCRQVINKGWGMTYIDPHGDGCEALLEYLASHPTIDPAKVDYLRPGTDQCFGFDPFAGAPRGVSRMDYESWLTSTVDRITRAVLRNVSAADQEIQLLRKRWLENVLCACGVAIDDKNTHLGMGHALIFTDPDRPEFGPLLDRVGPFLPAECLADFMILRATRRPQDRQGFVGSTVNKLREILRSPVVRAMFNHTSSVSQKEIILKRHIQLVNLRKSDSLSRDQANIVGGLLLNFLLHAAENIAEYTPPTQRVPHYLIIDEAENFIGEDLRMGFAELRKFGLSLCIAFQDLNCLRKGDLDLVSKVVENCGLQFTFCQQDPDNVEYLAKAFKYGDLDFTPLMVNEVLPDGYERVITKSVSRGTTKQHTDSYSESDSESRMKSSQRQTGESVNLQVSRGLSESSTDGESSTIGDSRAESRSSTVGKSSGRSVSKQVTRGASENITESKGKSGIDSKHPQRSESESAGRTTSNSTTMGETLSTGENRSETEGSTVTKSRSAGKSHADTAGETNTLAHGIGKTTSESIGEGQGVMHGKTSGGADAQGASEGETLTETFQARHKITLKHSGKLVTSVQDQLAFVMNQLASLPDRMVLVKCKGMGSPFLLRVHEVLDAYEEKRIRENKKIPYSPAWRASDMKKLLERVAAAHPYYFSPKKSDHAAALAAFLEAEPASKTVRDEPVQLPPDRGARTNLEVPAVDNPFAGE